MPEHCLINVPRQLVLFREGLYDVLTVIGRGRWLLRWGGSRLLWAQRRVRQAMRGGESHLP